MNSKNFALLSVLLIMVWGCEKETTEPEPANTNFKTIGGEVVLSAENYSFAGGDVGEWVLDSIIDGYLDKGYMQSKKTDEAASNLTFSAALPNLNYKINFLETGRYYVHLRTYAEDHSQNGFFATFDGAQINYGGANPTDPSKTAKYIYVEKEMGRWFWYTDGGGAEIRGLSVSFEVSTKGLHTFALYMRDTESKIDHIWLTMDEDLPQRSMTLDIPDPNLFVE